MHEHRRHVVGAMLAQPLERQLEHRARGAVAAVQIDLELQFGTRAAEPQCLWQHRRSASRGCAPAPARTGAPARAAPARSAHRARCGAPASRLTGGPSRSPGPARLQGAARGGCQAPAPPRLWRPRSNEPRRRGRPSCWSARRRQRAHGAARAARCPRHRGCQTPTSAGSRRRRAVARARQGRHLARSLRPAAAGPRRTTNRRLASALSPPAEQTEIEANRLVLHEVRNDLADHRRELEAVSRARAGDQHVRLPGMAVDPGSARPACWCTGTRSTRGGGRRPRERTAASPHAPLALHRA